MSLLDQIQRKKINLRPCQTLVTTPTGDVYEEKLLSGKIQCNKVQSLTSCGYVVDMKPDMQVVEVLPGLCMGSQDPTQDHDLLRQYNITHILSIGVKVVGVEDKFTCLYIEALDLPETRLSTSLEASFSFIDEARVNGKCVFVHCNAGVSRSASIVLGYLLKEGMTYDQAHRHLKTRREVIRPNEGFVLQLKEYEKQLKNNTF